MSPGGLLNSAIAVSDIFIHNDQKAEEELIVYTEGRLPDSKFTAKATSGDILDNAPIVVLINAGSASGSEIVAGALKDNNRAILVGTKTFGKGSVQTIIPLDESHGIKLTTALYYTPSGNSIQAKGIIPDITIDNLQLAEQSDPPMERVYEADLQGHLANGSATPTEQAENKNTGLAHTDYQLHQALNILKGLVLTQQ